MTARTQLSLISQSTNGGQALGSGTSIAGLVAAGAYIADPPGPNGVMFLVENSAGSSQTVTVRAGGNGTTASGSTNPGSPFTEATQTDLQYPVAAGATQWIGPFESDRGTQSAGSLSSDFTAGVHDTIWPLQLPFN